MQSGKLCQPTYFYRYKMNLTELFFGKFEAPHVTSTRTHRLGFSNEPRYIPLRYNRAGEDNRSFEEKLSKPGKAVLKRLRAQVKPITGAEMAKKTPFTRNYCSQIMGAFVKEGLATRFKVKIPHTRLYAYLAVKNG